ncbi:MAG: hypothetical protein M3Q36_02085 [bacterium]|nr:hypothetical protein [bacterium]
MTIETGPSEKNLSEPYLHDPRGFSLKDFQSMPLDLGPDPIHPPTRTMLFGALVRFARFKRSLIESDSRGPALVPREVLSEVVTTLDEEEKLYIPVHGLSGRALPVLRAVLTQSIPAPEQVSPEA